MRAPPRDDGVIKFQAQRLEGPPITAAQVQAINAARSVLFDHGLIGVYPDGVGFGNVSVRTEEGRFLISASATGSQRLLRAEQYCGIESFEPEHNQVQFWGIGPPSSESMTHGALYAARADVGCVLHVHHRALFDYLLASGAAHTKADVAYGTPAMASAVAQLLTLHPDLPLVFAMAGHDEGVIACGADIDRTLAILLQIHERTP